MKTITVSVTQEDIEKGRRKEARSCPIALAARRAFKERPLAVDGWSIVLHADREDEQSLRLPRDAERRLDAFDEGDPMEPFTFEVLVLW